MIAQGKSVCTDSVICLLNLGYTVVQQYKKEIANGSTTE